MEPRVPRAGLLLLLCTPGCMKPAASVTAKHRVESKWAEGGWKKEKELQDKAGYDSSPLPSRILIFHAFLFTGPAEQLMPGSGSSQCLDQAHPSAWIRIIPVP